MIVLPADVLLCSCLLRRTLQLSVLYSTKKFSSLTALRAVCEQVPPSEGFREAGYELRNINSGKKTLQW